MCTVTFMPRKTGYCLGMNRDEKRTRAKGRPPAIRNINGRRVLYPSEPNGGTWIALNDRGISFALINWYSVAARVPIDAVSRGEVIPFIGAADSPELTGTRLALLPLARINPFRLVGVFPDARKITEWRWDLKRLVLKPHQWKAQQWLSSGFDESMVQQVRGTTFRNAKTQTSAGTLSWLRRLHRSHTPEVGPFSTCMHRDDASTVSYTEVCVLAHDAHVRHVCGAPCGFSEMSFQSVRIQCDRHPTSAYPENSAVTYNLEATHQQNTQNTLHLLDKILGWRKGVFMRPFCHLVINAIRVDSPPCNRSREELAKALQDHRLKLRLVQGEMATKLRVSLKTLKNWERGRTHPAQKSWPDIRALLGA